MAELKRILMLFSISRPHQIYFIQKF